MSAAQGRERRPIAAERSRGAFNWRFYRQSFALHCKVTALCEHPRMADESSGEGPSVAGDSSHLIAALISQKLRDSGVGCEIVHPVATDAAVLRRDRAVIVLTVALLTALAWGYLRWLSAELDMGGMDMTGFRMIPSGLGLMMPTDMPWRAMEFAFVFAMWTVMMVGMMTPSAAPIFLMYARVGRQTEAQGKPLSATVWFAAGYFLVWVAYALFATLVQWALERTALLDFTMATTDNVLGGLVFVAAGLYQWTRLNDLCLAECQRPFEFVMRHGGYRRDAPGCFALGFRHGAYCVGCCWALMALLLVGGVMNVLWIVLLALLAFLERVTSMGRLIARLAGIVLVAGGAWLISMGMS
jgi:predicted metal-binding membrane protein